MQAVSQIVVHQLGKIPIDILTAAIGILSLLGAYGLLKAFHIPGRYIPWVLGIALASVSALACLFGFIRNDTPFSNNGLFGLIAFLIAVYAGSQWLTRRWYLWLKRYGRSLLTKATQTILLFLRKYHQLFGWLVLALATGHALSYGPMFARMKASDIITGILAWMVLAFLVIWGYWMERNMKKKRLSPMLRLLHVGTPIIFFVCLIFHI